MKRLFIRERLGYQLPVLGSWKQLVLMCLKGQDPIWTVLGSFGLVTVVPFTALCAGLMLAKKT